MKMMAYQLIAAYILDIIFGDPHSFPHPVRYIGKAIEFLEIRLRQTGMNLRICGVILSMLVIGAVYTIVYLAVYISGSVNYWLGVVISVIFIYTSISVKCLASEGLVIFNLLREGRLNEARKQLSMIVGRDTQNLNESEIIRATIETVAESAVDGVISPIFYAALGGAPLAMAYKAVNTLDSMVGYRNDRYEELGCFSARLDDAANFIPARVSAVLIPLASLLMRMMFIGSIKTILRDGRKSPSPNSGISEAGFAGALNIKLGGVNYYEGVKHSKPVIGIAHKDREIKDIKRSIYLMYMVSTLALLFAVIMLIIIDL